MSDLRSSDRAPGLFVGAGVDIADDAAIGAHVVLHDGVVLKAGSVVEADVPARTVVMGSPARPVREVGEEDLLERWR